MERLHYLLSKYRANMLTFRERVELMSLVRQTDHETVVKAYIDQRISRVEQGHAVPAVESEQVLAAELAAILDATDRVVLLPSPERRTSSLRRWWIAASVLLVLAAGAYWWTHNRERAGAGMVQVEPADIQPGKEGAVLTLADGRQVVLDSLGNGLIAQQNGSQAVIKNGALAYDLTGETAGEMAYNTMTTPKGRQFRVMLPDGTQVWLNAASSIRYPTVFAGKERKVAITGEVYFEVKKDREKPFLVDISGQSLVEVLGTRFNINSYADEAAIKTTLLEGSIKMNRSTVIKPGQQVLQMVRSADPLRVLSNVDTEQVMAWKNGFISFENKSLEEIMNELARWYDIEWRYEGDLSRKEFVGEVGRNLTLSQVFKVLEKLGVRFRLENNRRIVIMP